MNTPQAGELLDSYLDANNIQIKDWKTREAIIATMYQFAALAVSEAKNENIAASVKAITDEHIKGSIEPYLQNEKDAFFIRVGAMWMRDEILKKIIT